MRRLVLTSLAAILAGSTAQAQVGMRSPRAATSMGGSSGCSSVGGTAGTTSGGSATLGGGSALGMNQAAAYGMPFGAFANNGYGGYNPALMGTGAAYPADFTAANGFPGGYNTTADGYDISPWGNPADGLMVAASATKASTDASLRPRAKAKKSPSKTARSKTSKSKSS